MSSVSNEGLMVPFLIVFVLVTIVSTLFYLDVSMKKKLKEKHEKK